MKEFVAKIGATPVKCAFPMALPASALALFLLLLALPIQTARVWWLPSIQQPQLQQQQHPWQAALLRGLELHDTSPAGNERRAEVQAALGLDTAQLASLGLDAQPTAWPAEVLLEHRAQSSYTQLPPDSAAPARHALGSQLGSPHDEASRTAGQGAAASEQEAASQAEQQAHVAQLQQGLPLPSSAATPAESASSALKSLPLWGGFDLELSKVFARLVSASYCSNATTIQAWRCQRCQVRSVDATKCGDYTFPC